MNIKAEEPMQDHDALAEEEKTKIVLYDKVANVYLNGEICLETVQPIIEYIINTNMLQEELKIINLFIDSTGGDLDAAMKLIDVIGMSEVPVRSIMFGKVASAALMIGLSCHERLISENCSVLSHNASFCATSYMINVADPSQQREFQLIQERVMRVYMDGTGRDKAYIKRHLLKQHDVCLSGIEAIKHGLADSVLPRGMGWLSTPLDK